MELSNRLNKLINLCDQCNTIADIGTDHGYIPINLIERGICNFSIASDINTHPVERAKGNVKSYGLEKKIKCKKGSGLNTIKDENVQGVIIAGMGGNLIKEILIENLSMVKTLQYLVLQPTQNPEVLREYLYNNNFEILDEEMCIDEDIYYEFFKIRHGGNGFKTNEDIYYTVSPLLIDKNHPLIKEYIISKIQQSDKILLNLKGNTVNSIDRKLFLEDFKIKLERLLI
ncbi:SAM-dependent methyltransferase [Clostridium putrefaciens]|uniref:SAM-dependent methyltransferase n=1 Tax=Clostridium putrefaciens TaxID=99675 RepID=A0A381J9M0_9CLOT|nr:class I SAM-dependent methyltransferase [Clostridium putrefaciens]SUY47418.1 SAM-dependent methyltransferase [Clostridium putrefaciens]